MFMRVSASKLDLIPGAILSFTLMLTVAPAVQADAPKPAGEHVQKGELNERMSDAEDLYKKLRRTVRKAESNTESLELIGKIQDLLKKCKEMTPPKAETVPAADREQFIANYRKDLGAVIDQFDTMKKAITDGDNSKAAEIYKEITTAEDAGHEKYVPDKKEKK
jgi:soluble cytochrome b562